jgi:hypothetical protein
MRAEKQVPRLRPCFATTSLGMTILFFTFKEYCEVVLHLLYI